MVAGNVPLPGLLVWLSQSASVSTGLTSVEAAALADIEQSVGPLVSLGLKSVAVIC